MQKVSRRQRKNEYNFDIDFFEPIASNVADGDRRKNLKLLTCCLEANSRAARRVSS